MHRPREEQERQHPMKQDIGEVDAADNPPEKFKVRQAGPAQDDRNQRDRESKRHQADGLRQSEISIIDVGAYRAERDNGGDDLKWRHGVLWRVGQKGRSVSENSLLSPKPCS